MKKKLMIILSVLSILSPTTVFAKEECTVTTSAPSAISTNTADGIMPLSDVIVWKIKIVGGKAYRRRYNATKGQWIGDWELAP